MLKRVEMVIVREMFPHRELGDEAKLNAYVGMFIESTDRGTFVAYRTASAIVIYEVGISGFHSSRIKAKHMACVAGEFGEYDTVAKFMNSVIGPDFQLDTVVKHSTTLYLSKMVEHMINFSCTRYDSSFCNNLVDMLCDKDVHVYSSNTGKRVWVLRSIEPDAIPITSCVDIHVVDGLPMQSFYLTRTKPGS